MTPRTFARGRYARWATALALVLVGCNGRGAQPASAPAGQSRGVAIFNPGISTESADSRLLVRLRTQGFVAGDVDHAVAQLFGPLIEHEPREVSIPVAAMSPAPELGATATAVGVYKGLRPGDGYRMAVALYDGPAPGGKVIASGRLAGFTLASGSNQVTVDVSLDGDVTTPQPFPLALSVVFDNPTGNASGQPDGVVVVRGDTLQLAPGAADPNAQVRDVELWLDGSAAAQFADGQLLGIWYPDNLNAALQWNTGASHAPQVFGTPLALPTPGPATPFGAATPQPTPLPTPPVPPPAAVPAEGAPNHTLSFLLRDRNAPPGQDLIRVQSYPLTVVEPASLDVGIE